MQIAMRLATRENEWRLRDLPVDTYNIQRMRNIYKILNDMHIMHILNALDR